MASPGPCLSRWKTKRRTGRNPFRWTAWPGPCPSEGRMKPFRTIIQMFERRQRSQIPHLARCPPSSSFKILGLLLWPPSFSSPHLALAAPLLQPPYCSLITFIIQHSYSGLSCSSRHDALATTPHCTLPSTCTLNLICYSVVFTIAINSRSCYFPLICTLPSTHFTT